MKLLLFLGLFFLSYLLGNESISQELDSNTSVEKQKVLYLSYETTPKRVILGEIFAVTIKTLSTVQGAGTIRYKLLGAKGLKSLNSQPQRQKKAKYFYDTFYFKVNAKIARLPDFKAEFIDKAKSDYKPSVLFGEKLNVITLNPDAKYCNIIANTFELMEYKTSRYDNEHNIVVFVARAFNTDLRDLHLDGVKKQGIESVVGDFVESRITYYVVIEKNVEELEFSYFNLYTNRFSALSVPIIVQDDSVATQTDLTPKDQSKERLKSFIALGIAFAGFLLFLFRKKYIYILLILFPMGYVLISVVPSKEVCIRQGANIYLLPLMRGTIFETTQKKLLLYKEGSVKGFVKVKLDNEKIGWVSNEDICSN